MITWSVDEFLASADARHRWRACASCYAITCAQATGRSQRLSHDGHTFRRVNMYPDVLWPFAVR